MSSSRTIPKDVSDQTKYRDYFRCVWCGTHLTERHHIVEWSKGGKHEVDNLALLCPNCHTKIHRQIIDPYELICRIQNQKAGDRINGMAAFNVYKEPVFYFAGSSVFMCPVLIRCFGNDMLSYRFSNSGEILISCRFYSKQGDLVFWMHDNTFWTTEDFRCIVESESLTIQNKKNEQYLIIKRIDDEVIEVSCEFYLKGEVVSINNERMIFGNTTCRGETVAYCEAALIIE